MGLACTAPLGLSFPPVPQGHSGRCSQQGQTQRQWSLAGDDRGPGEEDRKAKMGAARLCVVGTRARWREMAGRAGAWPFMQNFLPPHLCRPRCSHGPGLGDPQRTPVCDSWGSLGPGLQPLPLGQPYRIPFPASWRTGPWSPCSASCGGGSQSRSVYCVSSDGAGSQEATGEAECAGQPGKPPATQACNLQRCAAWSAEPWGEVSLCPAGWGPNRAPGLWAGATAELGREAWPPLER